MRKTLIALVVAASVVLGGTACNNPPRSSSYSQVEDCDYEDRLEGDEDCDDSRHYSTHKKYKAKKKASKHSVTSSFTKKSYSSSKRR